MSLNQFCICLITYSLTDLEEKMKFAWAVFLLVLLFASIMDARRRDETTMRAFDYGKNECTPCKGKLKMRGSPSVIGKVYKFIRHDNSVYASSRCSDSKTFRSHLKKQTHKQIGTLRLS